MLEHFVQPDDPILLKVAGAVPIDEIADPATKQAIEKLLDIAYGHQKDRTKALVVGLAAPQVGVSKRIILVDILADGKGNVGDLRVYINPEITWVSDDKEKWYEGCWSTDKVCGIVARPKSIKMKAYTPEGLITEGEHSGYTARIFQHEVDHLNGHEFVDLITDDNNLHWVEDDEWPIYRNQEAWRNWKNKCPRSRWEQIKGIKNLPGT